MANPIKASDLYQDDGAITDAINQLIALNEQHSKSLEQVRKEATKLTATTKKLNASQKNGREEIEETSKQAAEIQRRYEKYNASLNENAQQIAALKNAQADLNRVNKLEAKLNASKEGSYNNLSAQYSLMKLRINQLTKEERESTKEGRKLVKQSKEIYEEMKRLQEATGKTSLNVGNYKESVKEAILESNSFGQALNVLSKTPLLGVIGLVVSGVTALFAAFSKTERGARLLERGTAALSGLMTALVGVVDRLATNIVKAFEDPQQAVKDLWEAIKQNIVNRFNGLIDLFNTTGAALQALWNRDLPALKTAATDAGKALIQVTSGLDVDKMKEFADSVIDISDAFISLADARRAIIRQNRELTKSVEGLTTKEALLSATADDTTKSFKEREEAAEQARQVLERRAQLEIQVARNNLSLIDQEIKLRQQQNEDVESLLDQQLSAYQAVLQAEREYTLAVRDNEKQRSELVQDRLERDLDILIDGFDNQKTINERILKDDAVAFGQRVQLFEQTAQLAEESFNKQIETIQKFTGVQVNANDLIATSDAVVLNEKIRGLGLSEIIEGRLLEIIRERRLATLDLADAEKELYGGELATLRSKALEQELELLGARSQSTDQLKAAIADDVRDIAETVADEAEKIGQTRKYEDIYELLGLNVDEDEKKAIESTFEQTKQQLNDLAQARVDYTNTVLEQSKRETDLAQSALQVELDAKAQGLAADIDGANERLRVAKENEAKALQEQQRAQRRKQQLDAVQQASNLVTASTEVLKAGIPAAIPLLAILWGTFAAAQARAGALTKLFSKGGLEFLDGGSHASGNDIPLYTGTDGVQRRAEGGEAMAIISKQYTAKYKHVLPDVINALNSGTFEQQFGRFNHTELPVIVHTAASTDTSKMEQELRRIRENSERSENGRVIRYKNKITRYVS